MARRERCSGCGVQLQVPPEAQTIQCAMCNSITRVRTTNYPLAQAQGSINHAANRFKTLISTVMPHNIPPVSSYGFTGGPSYGHGYYPPPLPRPAMPPPSTHGKRRAVLCGVSYLGTSRQIKGSVNDISCMKYFLVEKMGFPNDSILILTGKDS